MTIGIYIEKNTLSIEDSFTIAECYLLPFPSCFFSYSISQNSLKLKEYRYDMTS